MALGLLGVVVVLLIPVAIGWRVAFKLLTQNPTPQVKAFFWVLSALSCSLLQQPLSPRALSSDLAGPRERRRTTQARPPGSPERSRSMGLPQVVTLLTGFLLTAVGHEHQAGGQPGPKPQARPTAEQAIARIKQLGGGIGFDEEKPGRPVLSVTLNDKNATDEDLKGL